MLGVLLGKMATVGDSECLLLTAVPGTLKPGRRQRWMLLRKHFCCSQLLSTRKMRQGLQKKQKPEWPWVDTISVGRGEHHPCGHGYHCPCYKTVSSCQQRTKVTSSSTTDSFEFLLENFTLMEF